MLAILSAPFTIVGLIVTLIVVGLVWWAINAIMRAFGIGDPIATLIRVLFVVLVALWLVSSLFGVRLR